MPEEGWITKVGFYSISSSGGQAAVLITTGSPNSTSVLLWQGATNFTIPSGFTTTECEESAPNIHVTAGQEIFVVAYSVSGEARMCYESSAGDYILDGPYGGGPVPPGLPLTSSSSPYDDYRYANYIEYSDVEPVASATGGVKVWNGSAYVTKDLKFFNGTSYVKKPLKFNDGSTWKLTP